MNFNEVEKYLYSRIKDKIDIGYSAGFSLERVKYTLELLGNPQEKIKIIHIAGTSGKGSTASFISKLLTAHGFKTGLTLSPHIQDIRERLQINNELIDS
ncbi:MAG TPA: bifunctional folylpolyglutamate synthase/dihydrofolate synthase, partial [Candidatus Dojkabacteria bacterium]|nr:bifunctional folylpolyglutamate synthase/dihydrofolate synthase [Candidatus Dojkabacteria bacterium]